MAEPNPTSRRRAAVTAPDVGKHANARVDQALHDDLNLLLDGEGINTITDAIRGAVHVYADFLRWAWDTGLYPRGVVPPVVSFNVPPYNEPAPTVGQLPIL